MDRQKATHKSPPCISTGGPKKKRKKERKEKERKGKKLLQGYRGVVVGVVNFLVFQLLPL